MYLEWVLSKSGSGASAKLILRLVPGLYLSAVIVWLGRILLLNSSVILDISDNRHHGSLFLTPLQIEPVRPRKKRLWFRVRVCVCFGACLPAPLQGNSKRWANAYRTRASETAPGRLRSAGSGASSGVRSVQQRVRVLSKLEQVKQKSASCAHTERIMTPQNSFCRIVPLEGFFHWGSTDLSRVKQIVLLPCVAENCYSFRQG